jgi:hypothetical protein
LGLGRVVSEDHPMTPAWLQTRVEQLCARLGVSFEDVAGRTRPANVVRARQVIAAVLRRWPGPGPIGTIPTYPEIARAMGGTNHSSVVCRDQAAMRDEATRREVEEILAEVTQPVALQLDNHAHRAGEVAHRHSLRVRLCEFLEAVEGSRLYGVINNVGRTNAGRLRNELAAQDLQAEPHPRLKLHLFGDDAEMVQSIRRAQAERDEAIRAAHEKYQERLGVLRWAAKVATAS